MLTKQKRSVLLACFFGVAACASSKPPLPAPSSLWVEPELALRDIDEAKYPEFPDGYFISRTGLQLHLEQDLADQQAHDLAVNTLNGVIRGLEQRVKTTIEDASRNAWWARWAPALILSVSTLAAIAAGILGFELGARVAR